MCRLPLVTPSLISFALLFKFFLLPPLTLSLSGFPLSFPHFF